MSDQKPDGGSAFPWSYAHKQKGQDCVTRSGGMTLRQWYAGMAMQGLITSLTRKEPGGVGYTNVNDLSQIAFEYADAMIEEGKKDEK